MNRRQYSNQGQGFRRPRNSERSKFFPQNNNFQGYNNQNSINNNRYNFIRRRNNYNRNNFNNRNNLNNLNNINNNRIFGRRQQNNQNQNSEYRPFLSLGNRRRIKMNNNQNNQNNQINNNTRRPRFGNSNQNKNRNINDNAPLKRQVNRQERRFQNDKQKRKNEGLLYVSNLSEETVNTDLKDVFESYGRLKRCAVFFDLNTSQSKCKGVVQFTNNVNAQKAKNDLNGM